VGKPISIGFHPHKQRVVIEQLIKLGQFGFELQLKFEDHLKEVYGVVTIDYHDGRASG